MLENQSEYKVILAGDFNFHPKVVEWIRCDEGIFPDIKPGNTDEKLALQLLLDFTNDFELEQIVDEPTRESNILDLIFTNNLEIFSDQNIQILRPITDHNIVSFKIQINSHETIAANLPNNIRDISLYNFKSGNQELFKEALADTPWHNLFTPQTIETANENFNTALVQAANKAKVPKFKQKKDINDNNNIDVPNKERNRLMEQINNPGIRSVDKAIIVTRLEVLNKKLQNQHIEDRMREENKVINNIKACPAAFFKFANKNRKVTTKIGPLKQGNIYENEPKEIAEILSKQYASVFSPPQDVVPDITLPFDFAHELTDFDITEELVEKAISEMKPSSSPGPDAIPSYLYKNNCKELTQPIIQIWRHSMDTGSYLIFFPISPFYICLA